MKTKQDGAGILKYIRIGAAHPMNGGHCCSKGCNGTLHVKEIIVVYECTSKCGIDAKVRFQQ